MKKKIIQITPNVASQLITDTDYYGSWQTTFGINILKYSDDYQVECWNFYNPNTCSVSGLISKNKYGITFRYFPAYSFFKYFISLRCLNI